MEESQQQQYQQQQGNKKERNKEECNNNIHVAFIGSLLACTNLPSLINAKIYLFLFLLLRLPPLSTMLFLLLSS